MEIIAAFIGAIVAAIVTFWASNQTLSDSLDSKSGWREKLFAVASKYELTLDDAQTVRTALRLFPKKGNAEQYSFTWFSNIMIVHLDRYILKKHHELTREVEENSQNGNSENQSKEWKYLNSFDTEIVRLFAMFLLKYHFDHRSAMGGKDFLFLMNGNRSGKYEQIVKETCEHYEKLLEIKVRGRVMTEEKMPKDNSGQNESENKDKSCKNDCKCCLKSIGVSIRKCIFTHVPPLLTFFSILFSLLLVLGVFFKYLSIDFVFLELQLPNLLPWFAIAISILCGVLVCKKLNGESNMDGETEIEKLIEKCDEIYDNSSQNRKTKQSKQKRERN